VHHQEVIQVKKVKTCETEETCNGCLQVTILDDQFLGRSFDADAQIDSEYDRAVDEKRLGNNQQ
jgi:hypothetical protein